MSYDLNVLWPASISSSSSSTSATALTQSHLDLQRTLTFLSELSYDVVALNHIIRGRIPSDLACPIPNPLPFATPPRLKILRRATLELTDAGQNHRLSQLSAAYDILALRPTDEKTLALACQSLECDLISLDLSRRYPFFFRFKTLGTAVARGVRLELCYGQAIGGAGSTASLSGVDEATARRNLIANATGIIRATRNRGIVISSEACRALACRGPADVVNLACVWGLGQERGTEAVGREARAVVVQAEMKRRSYRGAVDVVYGGEKPEPKQKAANAMGAKQGGIGGKGAGGVKRKAGNMEAGSGVGGGVGGGAGEVTLSKRERKRREKAAREAAAEKQEKDEKEKEK